jgi:hypothetical protein
MHNEMAKLSTRDELKRNTIHAITEAGWLGPIVENMSEVASAAVTMNHRRDLLSSMRLIIERAVVLPAAFHGRECPQSELAAG